METDKGLGLVCVSVFFFSVLDMHACMHAGVDACMANLMRPGMYGAYHHITPIPDRERSFPQLPSNRNLFKKKERLDEKDDDKPTPQEEGDNRDKIKSRKVHRVYDVVS